MLVNRIAEWVTTVALSEIPADVIRHAEYLIFDEYLCGISAREFERAEMVMNLAQRYKCNGGEARILGTQIKAPSRIAAAANADLMNLLDADETFYNGAHFGALSTAAAMAEGERLSTSGEQVLLATILGFEVSARLNMSATLLTTTSEGAISFSELNGHGYAAIGAVAAIAALRGFDREQTANAMGLATWLTPTAKNNFLSTRKRFNSLKYSANWQIVSAAFLACDMAEEGYVGDSEALDLVPGIMQAQGYGYRPLKDAFEDLGEKWYTLETSFKPYPSCRFSHASLDALKSYTFSDRDLNALSSITVYLGPGAHSIRQFREPVDLDPGSHLFPYAAQFHMPYLVSMVLLGVPPGPAWFRGATLLDGRVQRIMEKVYLELDTELSDEWSDIITNERRETSLTRAKVLLEFRDREVWLEQDFAFGDPWVDALQVDDEFFLEKGRNFSFGANVPVETDMLFSWVGELRHSDDVADWRSKAIY